MTGARTFRNHASLVAVTVVIALAFVAWLLHLGGVSPLRDGFSFRTALPTAGALTPGARVTMAGVEVGKVESVELHGVGAIAGLTITDERVLPLTRDLRVQLRQHTPVGENYLALARGHSVKRLARNAVLPIEQSDEYTDVDQVLSTLQGPARERTRQLIQGLGGALGGRGTEFNALVAAASRALTSGSGVTTRVDRQRDQVASVVRSVGAIASALADRQRDIATVADGAVDTFTAIAARDSALGVALRELPSTLDQVRRTSRTLEHTARTTTPVVADAAVAVDRLAPAIAGLPAAAHQGRAVVGELGRAAPKVTPVLTGLRRLSAPLVAALPQLRQTLCQVNPMLDYLQPYIPDIRGALVNLGSIANSYDALGHTIALTPVVSDTQIAALPEEIQDDAHLLIKAGLLGTTSARAYDPYPKPGELGTGNSVGNTASGPKNVRAAGYTYPRVRAAC